MDKEKNFEKEINEAFEQVKKDINKPNILIVGGTGVGKSSLINMIFGKELAETRVGKPVTQNTTLYESDDCDVRIFDSRGYEINNESEFIELINWSKDENKKDDQIHLVWYCIQSCGKVQDFDIKAINLFYESNIPVAVIFTKSDLPTDDEMLALRNAIPRKFQNSIFETSTNNEKYNHVNDLITWSIEKLPEAQRFAFIKSQMNNLKAKWNSAHKMIVEHTVTAFAVGFIPISISDAPLLISNQTVLLVRILCLYNMDSLKESIKNGSIGVMLNTMLSTAGKSVVKYILKHIPLVKVISGFVAATITAAYGEAVSGVCYEITKAKIEGKDINDMLSNISDLIAKQFESNIQSGKKAEDYSI